MLQVRHSKYKRQPQAFKNHKITACSLEIIRALALYRFLSTAMIIAQVGGNERNVKRQLQWLWHLGYINRFAFPSIIGTSEFIYYLDNPQTLVLLAERNGFEITADLVKEVQGHREKKYYLISDPHFSAENQGRLLFIRHEAMVAHFHQSLSLACRKSEGKVRLATWAQGPALYSSVHVPKVMLKEARGGPPPKHEDSERLPLRPDAFFTLAITRPDGRDQLAHFFYEADRKTMGMPKMKEKFRAYFHFIRQQKFRSSYGVDSIRAVLVETLDARHAHLLRNAATDPIISSGKPCDLFWFTISRREQGGSAQSGLAAAPRALTSAEFILKRIWVASNEHVHSLTDE